MDTGGDAHHVVEAPIVLGVMGKSESKCVLDALGNFLPGSLLCFGFGNPLLQLGPLGDIALTKLLGFWSQIQAAETMQGLIAASFQCPVPGTFSFCGVYCMNVSSWEIKKVYKE